ncbi:MAG: OmpA family protein [bacterium]
MFVEPAGRLAAVPAARERHPIRGKAVLVVFLLVCCALMYAMARHIQKTGPVMFTPPDADAVAATPVIAPTPLPSMAEPEPAIVTGRPEPAVPEVAVAEAAQEPPPAIATTSMIELHLDGARVETSDGNLVVIFDDGIFVRVDQLRAEAGDALVHLAQQLAPYGDRVSVLVTGHTDNEPVPKNRPYKTNYDLGTLRALAVAHHLIDNAGMARTMVSTRSLGEQHAPYPNDTPENRARNRTVVITIHVATLL